MDQRQASYKHSGTKDLGSKGSGTKGSGTQVLPLSSPSLQQLLLYILLPVFVLSLLGIFSRPVGSLASVWPANAFLLGIMARQAGFTRPAGWLAALVGYLLADWLTGASWDKNFFLNMSNLVGVAGGLLLIRLIPGGLFPITQRLGVLRLIGVAIAASLSSSVMGAFAYPYFWGGTPLEGAIFWGVSEFANYIAFLPLILTMPGSISEFRSSYRHEAGRSRLYDLLPLAAFLLLFALMVSVDGPGILAIPIVGLLWCGLTYSLFTTAILTLVYCFWTLLFVAQGHISVYADISSWHQLMSLRLSISLIALAPLMNAIMAHKRISQISKLTYMASHDGLTDVLNRGGFYKAILRSVKKSKPHSFAFLMLDLDHFKSINDTLGHAAGDTVLKRFARIAQEHLPKQGILGRIGGEEFAVFLRDLPQEAYIAYAEKVRQEFEQEVIECDNGQRVSATVSIGLVSGDVQPDARCDFEIIGQQADAVLYQAKAKGRNCVVESSL